MNVEFETMLAGMKRILMTELGKSEEEVAGVITSARLLYETFMKQGGLDSNQAALKAMEAIQDALGKIGINKATRIWNGQHR